MDEKYCECFDEVIVDVCMFFICENKWIVDFFEFKIDEFVKKWCDKVREVFIDNEYRWR